MGHGSQLVKISQPLRENVRSSAQARRMAITSACAVESFVDVTQFQPSARILPSWTMIAPKGPPAPSRMRSAESRTAWRINSRLCSNFMLTHPPSLRLAGLEKLSREQRLAACQEPHAKKKAAQNCAAKSREECPRRAKTLSQEACQDAGSQGRRGISRAKWPGNECLAPHSTTPFGQAPEGSRLRKRSSESDCPQAGPFCWQNARPHRRAGFRFR
jgi:hypothetical protein